jgi:A/G-specific adenine glycosylase
VASVKPYFERFMQDFPTVQALSNASQEMVYHHWQGLGYYSRARNLHSCAKVVVDLHGGHFPSDPDLLLSLPGIGPYTAYAVASIAFDQPVVPVDGNVIRVLSRLWGEETTLPQLKDWMQQHAQAMAHPHRPGDLAQALMDLGATVCTPRKPLCPTCPWQDSCMALQKNLVEDLPRKTPKPPKQKRFGHMICFQDHQGRILMRQRPPQGLLANLWEPWGTLWTDEPEDLRLPFSLDLTHKGTLTHIFTHIHLSLNLWHVQMTAEQIPLEGTWLSAEEISAIPLSTLARKALKSTLPNEIFY